MLHKCAIPGYLLLIQPISGISACIQLITNNWRTGVPLRSIQQVLVDENPIKYFDNKPKRIQVVDLSF